MANTTRDGKTTQGPVQLALVLAPGTMARIGRTVQHLVIGLLDEPMTLTVIAPESEDVSDLPSPPLEIVTYPKPQFGRHSRYTIETLTATCQRRRVEVLHCLEGRSHGLTRTLSDRGPWPYLCSVQELKRCGQLAPLGVHCCGLIAGSLALREALLAARAAPADRVHLVRPGLRPASDRGGFARGAESTAIMAAGPLDDLAAFKDVVDSFAALRAANYDCLLWIMGNGAAEMQLRAHVQELKLTHHVTFVDRLGQHRLPGIFGATDIVVLPAATGCLETEVLEAMAAGAAVLVGAPVVGDFVIDTETAICYEPGGGRLTAKLEALMDNPDLAAELARRGQEYVRCHHSPTGMVAAMADLYRRNVLR